MVIRAPCLRWSVVTLEQGRPQGIVQPHGSGRVDRDQYAKLISNDDSVAKTALDRRLASPRPSLIISDEGLSSETGKGTDFIVL
jgi:hypothetical protein